LVILFLSILHSIFHKKKYKMSHDLTRLINRNYHNILKIQNQMNCSISGSSGIKGDIGPMEPQGD
jgi:hypothetical protein